MLEAFLTDENKALIKGLLADAFASAVKPLVDAIEENTRASLKAAKAVEDYIEHRYYKT